jgi:RND family efflux transporter MFP subunit
MNARERALIAAAVVAAGAALAAAAGYWLGARRAHEPATVAVATDPAKGGKKVLYYRNPMGLADTSPTPKKDSMGMDYVPVYEGDGAPERGVRIDGERMQKLGVRTALVGRSVVDSVLRASGRIEIDERRQFTVAPKFEGYIERLFVNATGQVIARGEPLFEAYSPELLAAQREYAIATQGLARLQGADAQTVAGMQRLAESALARLHNWGVNDEETAQLAAGGTPRRSLVFRAPAGGVVIEKKALPGMRFMPGETLFQVADLAKVWLIADVFEQDIGRVQIGQRARVMLDAYPGRSFDGRVAYVYPTLKADTRSAQVRIELANADGRLKPAMYAQVELQSGTQRGAVAGLSVPNDAVIDSGSRRIVLVALGDGRFEPRDVKLGARGDAFTTVLDGVREGESVVVAANFLIDAESNLKAALGSMTRPPEEVAPNGKAQVVFSARGRIESVDASGALLIAHEPIPSLKWPRMTMEFTSANETVIRAARAAAPGALVRFEFVQRKPNEWVVTSLAPDVTPPASDAFKR